MRVWMRVRSPNPFGLTLSTVHATVCLEDTRVVDGDSTNPGVSIARLDRSVWSAVTVLRKAAARTGTRSGQYTGSFSIRVMVR